MHLSHGGLYLAGRESLKKHHDVVKIELFFAVNLNRTEVGFVSLQDEVVLAVEFLQERTASSHLLLILR